MANAFVASYTVGGRQLIYFGLDRINSDNGNAIPLRISLTGLVAPGAELRSIRLYSEKNPVPLMAHFEFPVPPARADVDARVRLAGTQRIAAIAELANGDLHAAVADVDVTISACLDGT